MMGDWQIRLANALTQGNVDALPEVLVLLAALTACSTFGLVQFFTMLGTRWGDSNPRGKSFVLSIVVHAVVLLGWSTAIAINPPPPVLRLGSDVSEVSIPVRDLGGSDVEDGFSSEHREGLPELVDQLSLEANRTERLRRDSETDEAPRIEVESPAAVPSLELANVPAQPTPEVIPDQQPVPSPVPIQSTPAPAALPTEASAPEARPDRLPQAPQVSRSAPRSSPDLEISAEIPRTRGSDDPAAPSKPDDLRMSIPLESTSDLEDAPILAGQLTDTIRQGASPTPSSAPDGEFVPGGQTNAEGPPAATSAKRFSRTKSVRAADSLSDEPLPERIGGETGRIATATPTRSPVSSPSSLPSTESTAGTPAPAPRLAPGGGPNLPNRSPATYRMRKLEERRGTALRQGGSLDSERAVESSLKWLAKVQEAAGYWDADKYDGGADAADPNEKIVGSDGTSRPRIRESASGVADGKLADSGVTGLALLAFMGAGYTATDGEYAPHVDHGLRWLIRQQRSDGFLGGEAAGYDQMYCHAIATFALGEACGMQSETERSPTMRKALRRAIDFIVYNQLSDGGWRYERANTNGDMSMFGWQLMALKSADIAGVRVKDEVWQRMISFLKSRSQGEHDGLAGYSIHNSKPTPAMTAEALFCKQMIGIRRTNEACIEAVNYLRRYPPRITYYDEYYWYYGTLAMFQHGGEPWETWNEAQRDLIVQLQRTSGPQAGSWDPKGKWAGIGGRIYSTALSTLCLEVYYRYLPLYQAGQE